MIKSDGWSKLIAWCHICDAKRDQLQKSGNLRTLDKVLETHKLLELGKGSFVYNDVKQVNTFTSLLIVENWNRCKITVFLLWTAARRNFG